MILVDTSVWVELLGGRAAARISADDLAWFVTCGPVVQEVLQGLRPGPLADGFRQAFLALPRLSDPVPLDIFTAAADVYRSGRKRGYTIRSSMDCLIAAIAIQNQTPVWHQDRDFDAIARYTGLEIFKP